MVFSTADAPSSHGQADIAFPNQIDVRVNGAEVRANFRGLKNKPGSTRPVDITELLKSHPKAPSEMTVSYALTTKVRFSAQPMSNVADSALAVLCCGKSC